MAEKKYFSSTNLKVWHPWWKIGALLHFIATFFWDEIIFRKDFWPVSEVVVNEGISFQSEQIIHQISARALSFIFILCLWRFLYLALAQKAVRRREWAVFSCVFLGLSILHLFHFPESFNNLEWDNIINYSYSVRNIPSYWHNALTSIYYAACFYLFPFPITLPQITILFFSALVTFCLFRIHGLKLFAFFLLFIPELWTLITNPYRNNLYTILLLWATAWFLSMLQEGKKSICCLYIFILAVLAVWRTEGILFSLGLLITTFALDSKRSIRKILFWTGVWAFFIAALSFPQKLGTSKYYGKDYTLITTIDWLQPILNDSGLNLSYQGAEKDLEIISLVTPLDWIRESGISGYRAYNYFQGRSTNQSGMNKEESSAYFYACFRLVLHNLTPFARDRINLFCQANKLAFQFSLNGYSGPPCTYPEGVYDEYYSSRERGLTEMYTETNPLLTSWFESSFRSEVCRNLDFAGEKWLGVIGNLNLRLLSYSFSLLYPFYWILCQVRLLLQGSKQLRKNWQTALLLIIGAGEILVVTLGAPEPRECYYYPVYLFCTMLTLYTLECSFTEWYKGRKLTHG